VNGNGQLAEFLRSHRTRLRPQEAGISSLRRRRTSGLRREEVAERAGISSEWYVKLEQGRAISPSTETLHALARALMLTEAEQEHLCRLAQSPRRPAWTLEVVPENLKIIVESLKEPALIVGERLDVRVWNDAADAMFDFSSRRTADQNILIFILADERGRALFDADWAAEAKRMVSIFRAAYDQRLGDPQFEALAKRLNDECPEFGARWTTYDIKMPTAGAKTVRPLGQPPMQLRYATLQSNDDPALRLVLMSLDPKVEG
jgi:transcriptional regulator with XRE-family HTH domain